MRNAPAFIEELKKSDEYRSEMAKLEFATELRSLMNRHDMTGADLAMSLGVSAPMVSKILSGDSNLTIESMVKAAHCAGGKIFFKVVPRGSVARLIELVRCTDLVKRHEADVSKVLRSQSEQVRTTWRDAANDYEAEPIAA